MTTELEEEFFNVFGIHKKCSDKRYEKCMGICYDCKYFKYPEITDRILLDLICIAYRLMFSIQGTTVELLKDNILNEFIYWKDDVVKSEIQQLFKGEE